MTRITRRGGRSWAANFLLVAEDLFHGNSLVGYVPNYRQRQKERKKQKATKIKIPTDTLNQSRRKASPQVQNKPTSNPEEKVPLQHP